MTKANGKKNDKNYLLEEKEKKWPTGIEKYRYNDEKNDWTAK